MEGGNKMSKMSNLSIELQESPEKRTVADLLGGDKKRAAILRVSQSDYEYPANTWKNYWQLCLAVVDAAGDLAGKDKMLMNFRDKSKAFNVKHVIDKYYDGDVNQLKFAREESVKNFFKSVDEVNWYARNHDLDQVSAMTLMGLLENEKNREKFRRHIKHHIESGHPPFELDDLPRRDFRKTRA